MTERIEGNISIIEKRDSNNNLIYDENGEIVCEVTYDQKFVDSLKKATGLKRITKRHIQSIVKNALEEASTHNKTDELPN